MSGGGPPLLAKCSLEELEYSSLCKFSSRPFFGVACTMVLVSVLKPLLNIFCSHLGMYFRFDAWLTLCSSKYVMKISIMKNWKLYFDYMICNCYTCMHVRTIKRPSRVLMHLPFHTVMKVVEPATRILIRSIITLASVVITSFLKKKISTDVCHDYSVLWSRNKQFASKVSFIKSYFIPHCISVLFESHRIWNDCILQQWDRRTRLRRFPCSLDYCWRSDWLTRHQKVSIGRYLLFRWTLYLVANLLTEIVFGCTCTKQ